MTLVNPPGRGRVSTLKISWTTLFGSDLGMKWTKIKLPGRSLFYNPTHLAPPLELSLSEAPAGDSRQRNGGSVSVFAPASSGLGLRIHPGMQVVLPRAQEAWIRPVPGSWGQTNMASGLGWLTTGALNPSSTPIAEDIELVVGDELAVFNAVAPTRVVVPGLAGYLTGGLAEVAAFNSNTNFFVMDPAAWLSSAFLRNFGSMRIHIGVANGTGNVQSNTDLRGPALSFTDGDLGATNMQDVWNLYSGASGGVARTVLECATSRVNVNGVNLGLLSNPSTTVLPTATASGWIALEREGSRYTVPTPVWGRASGTTSLALTTTANTSFPMFLPNTPTGLMAADVVLTTGATAPSLVTVGDPPARGGTMYVTTRSAATAAVLNDQMTAARNDVVTPTVSVATSAYMAARGGAGFALVTFAVACTVSKFHVEQRAA